MTIFEDSLKNENESLKDFKMKTAPKMKMTHTLIFTSAARWAAVVIESKVCLIDLLTFSYSPTRASRDIVVEGNELEELEEVKILWKAILELG